MLNINNKQIYLACGYTDMRKSINGLMIIVQSSFKLDPFSETLFVFCNKSRDRLKILEWDGNGFWLHLKRIERGHFSWSKKLTEDEKVMLLTSEELFYLLGSPKLEIKLQRKEINEYTIV